MVKIPSWPWHKKRMLTQDKEDQENILRLLDGSVPSLHLRYRKLTHNEKAACKLALVAAVTAHSRETDFWTAFRDMENHIADDELYGKLFYQLKKEQEEERT